MQIIGSRVKSELPQILVRWARGYDKLDFTKALIFLILGKKGSGKSAILENFALRYPKIIDLFGSRDDEGLCYCRDTSPIDDILLVHGDNVDLDCSWDTCKIGSLTYKKMIDYEAVIPSFSFFLGNSGRFDGINKLMEIFWHRRTWKKPIYVGVREASSFIYSRIKQEGGGVNMKMAKADFIYWQREMRHFGYALGIDTIRWHSVDKEMRDLADWMIIKKVGHQGLPSDIDFMYRYIHPMSMASLPPNKFMVLTENASIGWGESECPVFHKEEGVDLLEELGIKITYGEKIIEGKGDSVGDREHEKIVRLYIEGGCRSMGKVAKAVIRSKYTIHSHINQHNTNIDETGSCPKCKRIQSEFQDVRADKKAWG